MSTEQDASLLQAASEGDLSKVQSLTEKHNANVNAQGHLNRTPLHLACLFGKMEVAIYLREHGANLNAKSTSGDTPIHGAVLNGHENIVEYLLSEGADWKTPNNAGKKPADYARKRPMKKLFEDAEKGLFNVEVEEDKEKEDKEKKPKIRKVNNQLYQKLIEDLVGVGYKRGEVLDTIYTLNELGDEPTLNNVMKELERRKNEEKKKEESDGKKEEKDSEENLCKICFEAQIDSVIIPCGHYAICNGCTKGLNSCPICRNPIAQIVKTFKS